jgi:homoserine kinase type II
MSVFTPVSLEQLQPWLAAFGLGRLLSLRGIAGGSVNTNYWLETESGPWILTLIEDRDATAVQPIMRLMNALAQRGLPVPEVRANAQGEWVVELLGRPATVVQALPGGHPHPTPAAAQHVGAFLAQLHVQHIDETPLPMNFNWSWQQAEAAQWLPMLNAEDAELMRRALSVIAPVWRLDLPQSWLHADVFPDNVLMHDGQLRAVIDWYFASYGPSLWDLAITLNAWCGAGTPASCPVAKAMWAGYCAYRSPSEAELAALGAMRCSAALRFWLTRLAAQKRGSGQADSTPITVKPPEEYRDVLRALLASNASRDGNDS